MLSSAHRENFITAEFKKFWLVTEQNCFQKIRRNYDD